MKTRTMLFFAIHFSFFTIQLKSEAQIIHVPVDYPTIQQAINASENGDTVLVFPGTYTENISFNGKDIILASYYLTTLDESYIDQTIIDGSGAGPVIRIENSNYANTLLCGFTIKNGISPDNGGGIRIYNGSPHLDHLNIINNSAIGEYSFGGGVYTYNSYSVLSNLVISGNNAYGGGGILCESSNIDIQNTNVKNNTASYGGGVVIYYSESHLEKITVDHNSAIYLGGGIYFAASITEFDTTNRCNIYLNNAPSGLDFYNDNNPQTVVLDTFTVLVPTEIFATPLESFSFDIKHAKIEQVQADLYVSPSGDDNNSGLSEGDPLKTIQYANIKLLADSLNPHIIHLMEGTYSPSATGEVFPVGVADYISLAGTSPSDVILDAEGETTVISLNNKQQVSLSNLTITGGYNPNNNGGGIYCNNSKADLINLIITGNHAASGGGIYFDFSEPYLQQVTVTENTALSYGGGLYFYYSNAVFDSINRCNILLNSAPAGQDIYSANYLAAPINIFLDTFTVLVPKSCFAFPLDDFSFDILNGKLPSEQITYFIAPEGNDGNTGLTVDDPFKTVQFALNIARDDCQNFYTLNLLNGIYSPTATGETFPLDIPESTVLKGESKNGVILDAEGSSSVILIDEPNVDILDLTITGGNGDYGGGIECYNCSPVMNNLIITGNYGFYGGGIQLSEANPVMQNVTITNNTGDYGGGIYFSNSYPEFDSINRCNIYLNQAQTGNDLCTDYGWGWSGMDINVVVDTFTVFYPRSVQAYPLANFKIDVLHGLIPQETIDLFISSTGDDANSGLSQDEPLKTIQHAISLTSSDTVNLFNFHLENGTYSPSATGELFPLEVPEYVFLEGESEQGVILDGEGLSGVININSQHVKLSDMTITGGAQDYGGGLHCGSNNPVLEDLLLSGNTALYGGGIYLGYNADPVLKNVTITGNQAENGGGIYFSYVFPLFDSTERCNIYYNHAAFGNDLYSESAVNVIVDTFSVMYPNAFHAYPHENFHFNILHGMIEQVDADLFVSPLGDNGNSGLTSGEPLKNIFFAYSKMVADSLHPRTINLLPGTYGPSSNGETYPLKTYDYVKLTGVSENEVFLDAEELSRVVYSDFGVSTEISNLTITGGNTPEYGGGIYCTNSGLTLQNVNIIDNQGYFGGGIYMNYCSPTLQNVTLSRNSAVEYGGGIYNYGSVPLMTDIRITENSASQGGGMYITDASPHLKNITITDNYASQYGGGICFNYTQSTFDSTERCNIYLNSASTGNDLYNYSSYYNINVIIDTFTVMIPNEVHASPLDGFSFDILHGMIEQANADLYVSPDGDNSNSGLNESEPLRSIYYATLKILADEQNPHTIHLMEGTYSHTSTGDFFPVKIPAQINLSGNSQEEVILDAEGISRVMEIINKQNVSVTNMTITGGTTAGTYNGGAGIYISNSDPYLENLTISGNVSNYNGGGISSNGNLSPYMKNLTISGNISAGYGGGLYCDAYSNPVLEDVKLSGNSASFGGGIYCTQYGSPYLRKVTISNNTAINDGGGIFFYFNSNVRFDSLVRCNIYLNEAQAGKDLYSGSAVKVVLDTFTVVTPKFIHAAPLENFTFDILNGKKPLINADLYISASGNNANSGLSAEDPLKTISFATSIIAEDSQHPNTIRLLNGTYSNAATGEVFPVYVPEYISIAGESEPGVILDAGNASRVFEFRDSQEIGLSNLTITGGYSHENGGGIYSYHSKPDLLNVTIRNNRSDKHGGGLYFDNSSPEMTSVTISENSAGLAGGGFYGYRSSPVMKNVTIENDTAVTTGGGLHFTSLSIPVMDSVLITGNYAAHSGGGLYLSSSDASLNNTSILENSSGSYGGGVHLNYADASLAFVRIEENHSENGGGMYCVSGEIDLKGMIIANNLASDKGGGIYGGSADLRLVNVSIAGNQAAEGGAVFCFNSDLKITNSILWNDSEDEIVFRPNYGMSDAILTYTVIQGGESGINVNSNGTYSLLEGIIDADPMFAGTGINPYSLTVESPCRNAGTPDTTGLLLPLNDLAGGPRIWEDRVDIGAYEWSNVGVNESAVSGQQSAVTCYPNPTSGPTEFLISNFNSQQVSLKVYNTQGQEVAVVFDGKCPGDQVVRWDAGVLPAGVYYYQLRAKGSGQVGAGKIVKY